VARSERQPAPQPRSDDEDIGVRLAWIALYDFFPRVARAFSDW
jgi:hypothetical protein